MFITQFARYLYMKCKHGGRVRFPYSAIISRYADFEGANAVGENSTFSGCMGHHSYIAKNCDIIASVGRFTSIGSNVQSIRYRHPVTYPYASTSPAFYSLLGQCGRDNYAVSQLYDECVMVEGKKHSAVVIGNDCWINSNVTLVSGITIGDGAVVLTGAVVTKDVPPYAVVAGVPARVIRSRYKAEDIDWLLKVRWWDMPEEWLRNNWRAFADIEQLKKIL